MFDKIRAREFKFPPTLKDQSLISLIDSLLQMDPKKRLGMQGHQELKAHPFFNGVDWDRLRNQELPAPTYDVVRDINEPSKIRSFSFYNPADSFKNKS